jgi:hypothetical protein
VIIPSKSVLAIIDLVFVRFGKELERLICVKLDVYYSHSHSGRAVWTEHAKDHRLYRG